MHTIMNLIQDYLKVAENGIQVMKESFGVANLLRGRRENLIPARGMIQGNVTFQFSFHGIGCALMFEECAVDFDFDESGNCAGFDAWRLWQFAKSRSGYYGILENQDLILRELRKLEDVGQLVKACKLPNSHMYQLKMNK